MDTPRPSTAAPLLSILLTPFPPLHILYTGNRMVRVQRRIIGTKHVIRFRDMQ
jgi:hypothetical protein